MLVKWIKNTWPACPATLHTWFLYFFYTFSCSHGSFQHLLLFWKHFRYWRNQNLVFQNQSRNCFCRMVFTQRSSGAQLCFKLSFLSTQTSTDRQSYLGFFFTSHCLQAYPFSLICWSAVMLNFSSTEVCVFVDVFCESRSYYVYINRLFWNIQENCIITLVRERFKSMEKTNIWLIIMIWLEGMRWKSFMRTALNMWVITSSTQLMRFLLLSFQRK